MNKVENKKQKCPVSIWVPTALVALVAILFLLGYLMGFRITYTPELENSWDAISAVATWAGVFVSAIGVIASFMAIWFAIQVPKKIAEQQNRIALFEKRHECYTAIQNLLALKNQIEELQTIKEIQAALKFYFGDSEKFCIDEPVSILAIKLNRQKPIIIAGSFLFSHYDDELLQKIINTGIDLAVAVSTKPNVEVRVPLPEKALKLKQQYCALCSNFEQNYLDKIESELNLAKNK